MTTDAFYKLVDHSRKVEIVWPFNSMAADIYTIPDGAFVGTMGILMQASPLLYQFQHYVESILDEVLAGINSAKTEHEQFVDEFDRTLKKHTGRGLDDPPFEKEPSRGA